MTVRALGSRLRVGTAVAFGTVPTLSFPMLALLGLALAGTSLLLIRRR
jgi:hypothetical protein